LNLQREEKCLGIIVRETKGRRPLGKPGCKWKSIIKMDLKKTERNGVDWRCLAQNRDKYR